MIYNFDEIIDRTHNNAAKYDERIKKFGTQDVIPLWIADMDFRVAKPIEDALADKAHQGIFGYVSRPGEYWDALAGWQKRRNGWEVDKSLLSFNCGVVPSLAALVRQFSSEGDLILVQPPVYPEFYEIVENAGRVVLTNRLTVEDGRYEIDFRDFEEKLKQGPKAFILSNPQNPVGRSWTREELKRMGDLCVTYRVPILSDEIHADLMLWGNRHTPIASISPEIAAVTITCTAVSKTFNLAGMMISNVMIRDEDLRNTWLGRHYNFDNPLSVAAAQAAYEKGEPWLEELRAYLDDNFRLVGEYLAEHLPKAKYRVSEATYLAWVDLNDYFAMDEDLPMFFAYKAGVLLEGGNMFVQNSDGFIRLNLACPKATLAEGLRRICEAVNTKHTV